MLLLKKYINTLKSSRCYGKAGRLIERENYSEAKKQVSYALELDSFEFMHTLHRGLKGEIEYCLGQFEESKNTFSELKNEITKNPKDWGGEKQQEFVERVNWFLEQLDEKTT